jgi:signal transduction histidine kinase
MASLTSVQRPAQLQLAIILDVAMLATGLAGALVRSRVAAALLLLHSTLFMTGLLLIVWGWFAVAAAVAQPGSAQRKALRFVQLHTMALWCSFPCIVLFEALCPDRLLVTKALYACADLGAKAVWAALLMQGNALVAESQRRRSREYLADVASAELVTRLRAALTLRDRLRAAASHELRTPLNSASRPFACYLAILAFSALTRRFAATQSSWAWRTRCCPPPTRRGGRRRPRRACRSPLCLA